MNSNNNSDNSRKKLNHHLDVLVVDDDLEQANILKLLIEKKGLAASFITESTLALKEIQKKKPSLVILDLLMPNLDGFRLCKQIKEDPMIENTKIIIYSGKIYEADRRKALSLGADLFLPKPSRAHVLLNAINTLINPTANAISAN